MRLNPQRLPQTEQHPGVSAQRRRGEFFPDLLRNPVFQFGMSLEETDKLMVDGSHTGVYFQGKSIPVPDPPLKAVSRERARPEVLEKGVVFDFLSVSTQDYFPQRGDFFLCFLGAHFDMLGHGFASFLRTIVFTP